MSHRRHETPLSDSDDSDDAEIINIPPPKSAASVVAASRFLGQQLPIDYTRFGSNGSRKRESSPSGSTALAGPSNGSGKQVLKKIKLEEPDSSSSSEIEPKQAKATSEERVDAPRSSLKVKTADLDNQFAGWTSRDLKDMILWLEKKAYKHEKNLAAVNRQLAAERQKPASAIILHESGATFQAQAGKTYFLRTETTTKLSVKLEPAPPRMSS